MRQWLYRHRWSLVVSVVALIFLAILELFALITIGAVNILIAVVAFMLCVFWFFFGG